MALDPVCGREISPKQSQWLLSYEGNVYHFCSGACRHRFDDDPNEFTQSEGVTPTVVYKALSIEGPLTFRPAPKRDADLLKVIR